MNYFIDTEFLELPEGPKLLSIGVVSLDGREYYAQNTELDLNLANEWVKKNVFPHLTVRDWKTKKTIAHELMEFCNTGERSNEFWAFFGTYDWYLITQLFGGFMNMPRHWPQYYMELMQLGKLTGITRDDWPLQVSKSHMALDDAKWNLDVYNFITSRINRR
jgi:hypothetical protein